jgi:hypothetical protein
MLAEFLIHLPQTQTDIALFGAAAALFYIIVAFITRYIRTKIGEPVQASPAFYNGLPMHAFHFATSVIIFCSVVAPNYQELLVDFRMLLLLAGLALLVSTIGWLVYASREEPRPTPLPTPAPKA